MDECTKNAEEPSLTMLDVLEEEKELEEESAAVLGGSDEKCCTYVKGYVKRQALYACLTCCPEARNDAAKRSGICLACSYQCHENHELIELYTKRNFRCDCPTETMGDKNNKCTFRDHNAAGGSSSSGQLMKNDLNTYNQNFSGVYCICKRPYPDAEDPIQDEMIQCVLCEDWYHSRHLNADVPVADKYSEMICGDCMDKYSILKDYSGLAVNLVQPTSEKDDVKVTEDDEKLKSVLDKSISDIMNISQSSDNKEENPVPPVVLAEESPQPPAKKPKLECEEAAVTVGATCGRPTVVNTRHQKGAVFWPDDWRKSLCTCSSCSEIYENLKISFLLDAEDTVHFYEENGLKKARETDYERGIRALSSMERTKQIDAITEYNRMKDKLKDFLHSFVVSQQVVTKEDINKFFQDIKNENSAKIGQPYFCR